MARIVCTVTTDLNHDQRMLRICSSLQKAGHDVLLVGRKLPASRPLPERIFYQKRLACFFSRGMWFYFEYNLRLFFFLLTYRADLINAVDLDTLLAGTLTSQLSGKACIFDAHEYFTELPELTDRPKVKRIWERIARYCIPKVQAAYTVGPALANILTEKYGTQFIAIRNVPFRRTLDAPPAKEEPPVILYQGALNTGRGLEQAITAMQKVANAQLWLAGEGDLSQDLRRLAKKLKVKDRVRFLGWVSPEDLWKLSPRATIGLNLLQNKGLNYYYSLANKAFDYIQAGIPSLNMDFPEYRQIQEAFEPFLLIDDLDPVQLAEKINFLLHDQEAYQQISTNCLKAASTLHWEKEEDLLLEIYQPQ